MKILDRLTELESDSGAPYRYLLHERGMLQDSRNYMFGQIDSDRHGRYIAEVSNALPALIEVARAAKLAVFTPSTSPWGGMDAHNNLDEALSKLEALFSKPKGSRCRVSDWKHQNFMTLPEFDDEGEGIRISVSKDDKLYLTLIVNEVQDKYGSDWKLEQACMFMDKKTGSKLLIALAEALNRMDWDEVKGE